MEDNDNDDILYANYLNPHPLLIPNIVRSILSTSSYSELKQFRLVCNSWEYEASSILKSQTQIRFPSEPSVLSYISQLDDNYCCCSYEFSPSIPLVSATVYHFFQIFGETITSLKLHQTDWSSSELWNILSEKLPFLEELSIRIFLPREAGFLPSPDKCLPNLKILRLNFSIDKPYKSVEDAPQEALLPTILKELLQAMPNLEEVHCPNWPLFVRPDKVVSSLFYHIVFQYPEEIQLKRLSHISINACLDNTQLFLLTERNFPLRELRLELYPNVDPASFYFLLKSLERTLKKLVLMFHPDYDLTLEDLLNFPVLQGLNYLSIHKYCGRIDLLVGRLPGLKTLLLNDSYVTDGEIMREEEIVVLQYFKAVSSGLEEVIIEGVTYSAFNNLRSIVQSFPGLKRLTVKNVNDEMLRLIFAGLEGLEELDAEGKFTDAGVSGIEIDVCQNIFEVEDVERVRIFPYIGRLKNLRRLTLNSWSISYLSVLLGVDDCKKLKSKRLVSPHLMSSS